MNPKINELLQRIRELESEIEADIEARRSEFRFRLEDRKVRFEKEVLEQHRRLKTGLLQYLRQASLRNLISAPVIYAMIFPLLLLDLSVSLYQWICFPLYRIPRVKRGDFFHFDRGNLAYLNTLEKFNCTYCAYGNGLAAYVKHVVALTEQYWCPIKHAKQVVEAHERYQNFVDFGDAEAYRKELEKIRCDFEK